MILTQIPTDAGSLEAVTRYLPAFTIMALGFFCYFLVRFILKLLEKEQNYKQDSLQHEKATSEAVQSMGKAIETMTRTLASEFGDVKKVVIEQADLTRQHLAIRSEKENP